MSALIVVALALGGAAPVAIALAANNDGSPHDDLVSVRGRVTAFVYDDEDVDDDQDDTDDDIDEARIMSLDGKNKIPSEMKVTAFVIDNETMVECGPWWYWVWKGVNITDFVHIGDWVNVTGELEEDEEDGMDVLSAWHIENITTDDELTIKEEGRPPWAGGPKALGIDPWPMSQ